ncbi:MAG: hypothetical protein HY920_07165 [Elusimicrobia bacterium]|nr:hypothetical protein [Elusimicrobiota bacterium]
MPIIKSMQIYGSVVKATFQNLRQHPSLFKPFLYLAFIEMAGLALIFYAPQWPVSLVLGQPIRAFYGEAAMHYPTHLLILPPAFRLWQIVAGVLFGSLLTGIAMSMYNQKAKGMSLRFGKNFKIAINRYLPLLAYTLVTFIIIYLVEHFSGIFIKDRLTAGQGYFLKMGQIKWGMGLAVFNILFSIAVETLFLYAPLAIIIENKGFWKAAGISIKTVFKYFVTSGLLVLIPALFYLVAVVLKVFIPRLMDLYFPEISLLIILWGIFLAFIVNTIIAVSATILYLSVRESK